MTLHNVIFSALKAILSFLKLPIRLYRNISIRYKLLLVLNILMIIPLAGLSYINYKNSEISLTKKSTQYTQDILKMIEIRLNDYVKNLDIISQELLPDERLILNIDNYTSTNPLQLYEEAFVIEDLFRKTIMTRDELQSIALISNKGNYHPVDLNSRAVNIKKLVPYKGECYEAILAEARKKSGLPVFYLDLDKGRAEHLFMARMVYNINSYEELGVMIFVLKPDYINTIFKDLVNEDTQNIMILSANNEVIVDRQGSEIELITQKLPEAKGSIGWFLDDSQKNIVSYNLMEKEPGWKIVSLISLANLYRDIELLRQSIIITSIIIVLVLSIVSLLMTADFIKPFKKLINGMERVQKGDKNVSIALERKDEIGYLGESFNQMVKEMHTLSDWVYQEQLTRKEAELKALQSQINPHFLFNTLESINWMAQLNKVPEISDMVSALSSLMEASIGRDDKLITIREEIQYINNYYLIMKKRFEERIELIKIIDENALDICIPRLLIQPLIENAIHHGIENSEANGHITLSVKLQNAMLYIMVEDDGEGISEEDLLIINENLSMDNETYFKRMHQKKIKSVGLENVNRRIKLFYGEHFGLKIESKKDCYTKVVVTVPLTSPEKLLQGDVL